MHRDQLVPTAADEYIIAVAPTKISSSATLPVMVLLSLPASIDLVVAVADDGDRVDAAIQACKGSKVTNGNATINGDGANPTA